MNFLFELNYLIHSGELRNQRILLLKILDIHIQHFLYSLTYFLFLIIPIISSRLYALCYRRDADIYYLASIEILNHINYFSTLRKYCRKFFFTISCLRT